jgi:hypothetical protein
VRLSLRNTARATAKAREMVEKVRRMGDPAPGVALTLTVASRFSADPLPARADVGLNQQLQTHQHHRDGEYRRASDHDFI